MSTQSFIDHMHAFTRSLVRLDTRTRRPAFLDNPGGERLLASGFIIEHTGSLVLLSASHCLEAGSWALETAVNFDDTRETLLYSLGPTSSSPHGDLAWVVLDEGAMLREFQADPRRRGRIFHDLPRYSGPLHARPTKNNVYGFAARNSAELATSAANPDLLHVGCYELGMVYVGSGTDGRYRFKLARSHQGDRYYQGASGAPIADPEGRVISLVSGGDKSSDVIWGTPLADLISGVV